MLAPLGLWASPRGLGALLWVGAGVALVVLPPMTGLRETPPLALLAGAAGLLAGRGLGWTVERSRSRAAAAAAPAVVAP